MQLLSYPLQIALALSRTISASISLVAAWIIVYKIVTRYRANQRQQNSISAPTASRNSNPYEISTYHRILLGISVFDILHTTWAALSTLPVPADSGVVFGRGTTATCTAQGFFVQLSTALPLYIASLNTYFMLKIRYNIPNDVIRKKYEPWFHLVPALQAVVAGIVGVALQLFNPIVVPELGCWIALYPPLCDQLGNCVRGYKLGERLDLYVWVLAYGWLFASFVVVVINSVLIYTAIRSQERRNERYISPPGPSDSNGRLTNSNYFSLRRSSIQSTGRASITNVPLPEEIHIDHNYEASENNDRAKIPQTNPINSNNFTVTTDQETRDRSAELSNSNDSTLSRIRREKVSRIAAYQCFLFCSSTFVLAFLVFMPWILLKISASSNVVFFFVFMVNIVNPSQGLFNLYIIVRLHYKRLRTTEEWSRLKCIKVCLFSPDIH